MRLCVLCALVSFMISYVWQTLWRTFFWLSYFWPTKVFYEYIFSNAHSSVKVLIGLSKWTNRCKNICGNCSGVFIVQKINKGSNYRYTNYIALDLCSVLICRSIHVCFCGKSLCCPCYRISVTSVCTGKEGKLSWWSSNTHCTACTARAPSTLNRLTTIANTSPPACTTSLPGNTHTHAR